MATKRFSGTVEPIATLGVAAWGMAGWIADIPFEDWPQQDRLSDGQIRPAMVNDPAWHGLGDIAKPVIAETMRHLGEGEPFNVMLSVVMPGAQIDPHVDQQSAAWLFRVHVPLLTNDRSWFNVGGQPWNMQAGIAYKVNTEAMHGVVNAGGSPRVHFMFDVRRAS